MKEGVCVQFSAVWRMEQTESGRQVRTTWSAETQPGRGLWGMSARVESGELILETPRMWKEQDSIGTGQKSEQHS